MKTALARRIVPLGLSLVLLSACAKRETPVQAGIDPNALLEIFKTNGTRNHPGWSNAAYDRLMDAAANTAELRSITKPAMRYSTSHRNCERERADETPLAHARGYHPTKA